LRRPFPLSPIFVGYSTTLLMATPKKETTLAELQALITGIPLLCVGNTLNVAGKMYTPVQAVAVVTTRAAAAAKAAATRKARGTESKKKKALITGDVTGVIITPTTSPPPTPASEPAATGTTPA